ncbi:peptidyl-tRNA hydrolase 2 [Lipomyces oligophaga]|uniref:peptidyl-tRNA hydrolase 2 n=1 Tax=Lipomyces oligophaga TaxID=45792 RepID=UPI0034CDBD20
MQLPSDTLKIVSTGLAGFLIGAVTYACVESRSAGSEDSKDEESDEYDSESDQETIQDSSFSDLLTEHKMILVVRTDLGMTKGKAAAQCCHAALGCYKRALKRAPNILRIWESHGQPKITLQTKTEEALEIFRAQAESLGITHCLIHDAGRTQIAAGSATVLGLGPAPKSKLDMITGELKLY